MDKITSALTSSQSEHDSEIKSIRHRLDSVRMNLGAELAELRQRRSVAQRNIANLVESGSKIINACVTVYSAITTLRAVLSFFSKGVGAKHDRRQLVKGLVVQAGFFAAQKAWKYYEHQRAMQEVVKPEPILLLDKQKQATIDVSPPDPVEIAPPAVPVCSIDYSRYQPDLTKPVM